MLQKIKTFISSHRLLTVIILIVIAVGCYYIFKSKTSTETRYVTQVVKKGSVTSTVTGTGQVEASDTIDLKPKATGDVTYVGVKAGEVVKKGKLIASIDSRDAKMSLESAQIALDKLVGAPDSLTLLQKQNSLTKSYSDAWNTVSTFITDMNSLENSIDSAYDYNTGFFGNKNMGKLSSAGKEKVTSSFNDYYTAKNSIQDVITLYKSLSRTSSKEDINNLVNKAYDSAKTMSNAMKETESSFNYVADDLSLQNDSDAVKTNTTINSWVDTSNNDVNNLLTISNSLNENTQSLNDLLAGANQLDIKSAQLNVESKQNAYNDCFIYAPFDGTIATLTAQVGESALSSVGTIITNQQLATISLNEVDIAKIKLGQKVTLTFDAVDGLTITGEVAEIDSIGTVSQGVVSYSIKISFDVNDVRIKPGMSVSATIITDMAQDVITVPNSAVKSQGGTSYVETFSSSLGAPVAGVQGSVSSVLPQQVEVTLGLADDTNTEIVSGLKEGDIVVTKTITGTTTTTKSTTPSLLNAVGGGGRGSAGGAATRVIRGD